MTTNDVNTLSETKDGREFFNSDGTDVKPEVISMLGPFARVWKTASQRATEMAHPLTTFSPMKVVTVHGAKYVRIPPSVEKCDQNREAYSARMGAIKMEWSAFDTLVDNVKKDAGLQLIQFKALPAGREKEALEKIVIQKGFIVIAWALEVQTYAEDTKRSAWGLMDIRHLDSPRFMSQGTMKLRLEEDGGEGKQYLPSIMLQDEIVDQDDPARSTAFYITGLPPTAPDGEMLPFVRTGMQDVINSPKQGKSSSAKKSLRAFTVRRVNTEDGTRVYSVKTANKKVRDELREIFVGGTEQWSGMLFSAGGNSAPSFVRFGECESRCTRCIGQL